MMKQGGMEKLGSVLLAVLLTLGLGSLCRAEMNIQLKDGRVITLPVKNADVVSITYSDKPAAGPSEQAAKKEVTWDFETGDLTGWTVATIGQYPDAFASQPTLGDNPTARKRGQPSKHQGKYWIATYEKRHTAADRPGLRQGDKPQGTITSEPFTIHGSKITFLIGGGCKIKDAGIELLVDGKPVRQATGRCHESMQRLSWEVADLAGKTARLRIYDRSSKGWGHVNLDDIRFE